ncbi:MAG: heme o synthase [Candidatus Caldarchaeum sp.]|nr:heme o synthase [Candidatus Caldarchaeum sp.]
MKAIALLALTKPKITLLNIFTALASYVLAGGVPANAIHLILAGYLSVGGASALNHFLDTDIDRRMKRTAKRPLPSGKLSPWTALAMGVSMVSASVVYSAFAINLLTSFFIFLGAAIYVFIYTVWLKRRSVWNIVIGGLAGSCAPLAGWTAAGREISAVPLLLAFLVFLWTPGHFWALASRAVKDYESAGIPMLPVKKGVEFTSFASLASNVASVAAALILAAYLNNFAFYLLIVLPVSAWLVYASVKPCVKYTPDDAWKAFKISSPWLFVVFAAAALSI